MYNIEYTNKFKKQYKLALKRGNNELLIQKVIAAIANKSTLPVKYKVHKLSGKYEDCWECIFYLIGY